MNLSVLRGAGMISTEGFYGLPMGVAVEYIFLFALLGGLLLRIGTGEVFVDIARGLTGRMRGGPGLSEALSSALLGTINGSAVANVVTTGAFTIPLMKRVGYSPTLAGAIEAAASSAGQILPPVMGAAAFLMAEIIGYLLLPLIGLIGFLAAGYNGLFKAEVIHRRGPWRSFEAVEYAALEWVDWFNNRRLLEPIGNIPPAEAEANFYAALETEPMAA